VNEIKNAGDRAAVLTKQLLAFGRKQIMQPEVLDLGQIVSGMVDVLSKLLGENIEMQIRITPNLNKIKADAGQLEQVIINLIVNARDAITGAGEVVVAVQNIALDGKTTTRIGELPSGDYLMLSISDDGEGMNEETLSHIFEPFYTTKTIGKGTGLGLSSVFGIASQSGGGIEVQTHPGRGSDFRIYFPCTDISELDIAAEAPNRRTESLEGNETVLIVEDEEVILNMLTRSLERLGYTVLAASHGEEALLVAEKHQGRIDIIITDIVMPKMSGYELVERLVPLRQEMAVLFTTGYDEGLMSDQALTNPQKHLIHKPFVAQDIAGKIRAILDNPPSP
jgi:CheY-like chemotaxis protein